MAGYGPVPGLSGTLLVSGGRCARAVPTHSAALAKSSGAQFDLDGMIIG
jgi:hypothetical protein